MLIDLTEAEFSSVLFSLGWVREIQKTDGDKHYLVYDTIIAKLEAARAAEKEKENI